MKAIEELVTCTMDYGSFLGLADCLGRRVKESHYYSPFEQEFLAIDRCVIGDGFRHFKRVDEYMDPDFFESVDLWVFPDIGYGGFQRYLRSLGKAVWGSMGASDLELYRTRFLKVIGEVGLQVIPSEKIIGLSALSEHLKHVENKWIKVNRFRANMETWHHIDYAHSMDELAREAVEFGGLKEHIVYVVQDPVEEEDGEPVIEIGYDGFCVDGQYPPSSFSGYEKKNELYLGSMLEYSKQPEEILAVNEAMAPVLAEYGYRNFVATEIRKRGKEFFYIDPTHRLAGQTMEHQFDTCANLPEVLWAGAHGEVLQPVFQALFAAEATLHYKAPVSGEAWKVLNIPDEVADWVKLYHCCRADGLYHFPPHNTNEVGVIIGIGDTIEEAIEELKGHFEALKDEPVTIELSGFADLLREIHTAGKAGVEFTDQRVPEPAEVLEDA